MKTMTKTNLMTDKNSHMKDVKIQQYFRQNLKRDLNGKQIKTLDVTDLKQKSDYMTIGSPKKSGSNFHRMFPCLNNKVVKSRYEDTSGNLTTKETQLPSLSNSIIKTKEGTVRQNINHTIKLSKLKSLSFATPNKSEGVGLKVKSKTCKEILQEVYDNLNYKTENNYDLEEEEREARKRNENNVAKDSIFQINSPLTYPRIIEDQQLMNGISTCIISNLRRSLINFKCYKKKVSNE